MEPTTGTDDSPAQAISWVRDYKGITTEHATFHRSLEGLHIDGDIVGAIDNIPLRARYGIRTDRQCRVQWCIIEASYGKERRCRILSANDAEVVDFVLTPSTNTVALDRLALLVGERREITVAFVDLPDLQITRSRQAYARTSQAKYEYQNLDTGFHATLDVDKRNVVQSYGNVWRCVGASSAADLLPLDDARTREFATALASVSPSPELAAEASDLAWLVGGWAGEVRDFDDTGRVHTSHGEWWFSWVLEGRALQDVWVVPARGERANAGRRFNRYGTTLRWFDRSDGQWHVIWRNPVTGARNELVGRRYDDSVVLTGIADGVPIRWSFLDITSGRLHWTGEEREPSGVWRVTAEFLLNRLA